MKRTIFYLLLYLTVFVCLLAILFSSGCSQNVILQVDLRSIAADFQAEDFSGKISFLEEDFSVKTVAFSRCEEFGGVFSIKTMKNDLSPVLVTIDTPDSIFRTKKVGFLYPITTEADKAGGFCAHIFIRLLTNSFEDSESVKRYCSFFNWNRFYQKVLTYDEPFLLDDDAICTDIANATFSERSFKMKQ